MIPQAFLQAWSATASWPDFRQIEQDLIISRALCDLFNAPTLRGKIAFRGGTAINKLLFQRPLRYSEDIDLVQTQPEPIGGTVDAIRDALAWLGGFNRNQAGHSMHLVFRFAPEADLQRRKNRDLFDLAQGLKQLSMDVDKLVACFDHYLALEDTAITRAEAEQRMLQKLTRSLTEDIAPLLPAGVRFDDADALCAFERIWGELVSRLRGDPWKLTSKAVAELRERGYPTLLQELG